MSVSHFRCSPCWNTFLVIEKIWEALYLQGNGMRAWTNETMDIYFIMFGRWRPQWSSIYIHSALLALCENLLSPIPHVHYSSGFCAPRSVVRLYSYVLVPSNAYHPHGQAWAMEISWAISKMWLCIAPSPPRSTIPLGLIGLRSAKSSSEGTVKRRPVDVTLPTMRVFWRHHVWVEAWFRVD